MPANLEIDPETVYIVNQEPPPIVIANQRSCCTRILCILFCCDTNYIGQQDHLQKLNDEEIAFYHRQINKELELIALKKKQKEEEEQLLE